MVSFPKPIRQPKEGKHLKHDGKIAKLWELFKQKEVFPDWFRNPEQFGGRLLQAYPRSHDECTVAELRCQCRDKWTGKQCTRMAYLYWSLVRLRWVLESPLQVGHVIGRDREPGLRFSKSNVRPECSTCNQGKEGEPEWTKK
jgi:hypothetical protein